LAVSIFLKDQWKEWARDWAISHYPQKGLIYRNEKVVGERKGLLIKVGWEVSRHPYLAVCIRFPRVIDPTRLRQALIDDPTLDTLPGKGSGRRKMVVEGVSKKGIRLSSYQEFTLTNTSLVWHRVFSWSGPKPAQVQSWVDAMVASISRATPVFDGRCESCGTNVVKTFVLVDDLPTLMCATCQQRVKAEGDMADRTYDMIEVRHVPGTVLACLAAALGAVGWAAIGALTQRIYAIAAIGIGALVAWAYKQGAGRVDAAGRAIAGCLTLISVVLGEVLLYAWWVAQAHPEAGFNLDAGWYAYLSSWEKRPADEVFILMFALIGAWFASKMLARPKLRAKIETAGEPGAGQRKAA
jgi:hypothetical protein